MAKTIRFFVLLIIGMFATTHLISAQGVGKACVFQQDAPTFSHLATNYTFLGLVDIFDHSNLSAAQVYSYGIPLNASYNGSQPPALSGVSQLFLVQTNDASGPSLFVVHDQPLDGTGGFANTLHKVWDGAPPNVGSTSVLVYDQEMPDDYTTQIGSYEFGVYRWWLACCTDGVVLGTLEGEWIMDSLFLQDPQGIDSWQVSSATAGGDISLVIEPYQRVRLQPPPCIWVDTDLKPGSNPNCVNTQSGGMVSVAILTTDDFDALTIDPPSVLFGEASPLRWSSEDAEGDGDLDLVLKFMTRDVAWPEEGSDCDWVQLSAVTLDGIPVEGAAIACIAGEPTCKSGTPTP